ncbi:hypothetical protein C8J57DRAFT_60879 [Mycena rebaudengoi]|jgi:hypothetical protein|nr:hypothetical protein C8J57DRAFT_60879 [Mycena rebaudengoi]
MKFAIISAALVAGVSALPAVPLMRRAVDPALVPQFGIVAGTNPTGTGDCDGVNGIKIPCFCPPDRNAFIDQLSGDVAAGRHLLNPGVPAPFPTDNSVASQIVRLQTSITMFQNLRGPGVGCPAVSSTFLQQIQALQAGGAPPPPPPPPPAAPAPPPPAPAAPAGFRADLVPQFGIVAGTNPTGTGDCDGVNGIKIPCSCPPDRNAFIDQLAGDVAAGNHRNNPGVPAPFPTDDSKASQIVRLQTSITMFQNLRGPGVGCPAVASTFLQQIQALQ